MRALSAAIGPLLASLLLIASVIAPAHCLARALPSADRLPDLCRSATVFDAAPAPEHGTHYEAGICIAATGLAIAIAPPAPAMAQAGPPVWQPVRFLQPASRTPGPATFLSPLQPRAPPGA